MCEPVTATAVASSAAASATAAATTAAVVTPVAVGAAPVVTAIAPAAIAPAATGVFGTGLSWSSIGSLASVAGSAFSAMSAMEQGKSARQIAEYNAKMGEISARDVINRAALEQEKQRQKVNQLRGTQNVNAAANNIITTTGTAADIAEQTVVLGKEDENTIRNNALRSAWGYRNQASLDYMQGVAAERAGRLNAAGTLITAGAKAAGSKWWKDLA